MSDKLAELIAAAKEIVDNCKRCNGRGEIYRGDPEFDPDDCHVCYRLRHSLKEVQDDFVVTK
jgi:hypothetical protein